MRGGWGRRLGRRKGLKDEVWPLKINHYCKQQKIFLNIFKCFVLSQGNPYTILPVSTPPPLVSFCSFFPTINITFSLLRMC
jgi:hypothetical protein